MLKPYRRESATVVILGPSFFSGYSSVPFFSVDKYGAVFQLAGFFLAVPGTAKYGGNFLAVMKYGGTIFGGPGNT